MVLDARAPRPVYRLQSTTALHRFRLGSWLLLLFLVSAGVTPALALAGMALHSHALLQAFFYCVAAPPALGLAYLIIGNQARCPLCMNPPLTPRRCQKHKNARRSAGSIRLGVAAGIFFKGRFVCPYCGETTLMEVSQRRMMHRQIR